MDCIIIDDDNLSAKAIEHLIKKEGSLNMLATFTNPELALSFLANNKQIGLLFLDIEMPEMSGMEFIAAIEPLCSPKIILTSSHKQFAVDAFDNNVTDYLVKPIAYPRFFKAIVKAKDASQKVPESASDDNTLFVKKGSSIIRLKKSDILWIEALGDYVTLNTAEGKYNVHSTMKSIEDKMPSKDYIRVHRSFIVRIDKIDSIEDGAISYGRKLIPIGKSYKEEVFKRLNVL